MRLDSEAWAIVALVVAVFLATGVAVVIDGKGKAGCLDAGGRVEEYGCMTVYQTTSCGSGCFVSIPVTSCHWRCVGLPAEHP